MRSTNIGSIQKISVKEMNKIRGGETKTFSVPGFSATVTGDFVDIQQDGDTFLVTSQSNSSSNSGSSINRAVINSSTSINIISTNNSV